MGTNAPENWPGQTQDNQANKNNVCDSNQEDEAQGCEDAIYLLSR